MVLRVMEELMVVRLLILLMSGFLMKFLTILRAVSICSDGQYSGSIVSEKSNLTRFLRFSFHGITLKPRRNNICMIPAATAIE